MQMILIWSRPRFINNIDILEHAAELRTQHIKWLIQIMQMKTKRLSSVFAGKLNVNMKPTLAAAKFKNQQTKKQSEILEQEEEEEDIISSGNAYLIRGLGEVIFVISADLFYCLKF